MSSVSNSASGESALPTNGAFTETSMLRLIPAIFLSSAGAVLFSLLIFRLLSFFIMPSMFFALLLVGFPIGAALASLMKRADVTRFRQMLVVLQVVMILTVFATLYCKHVDYMRANLVFGIEPGMLLMQVMVFALFFLPFFAAYGAAEYIGYLAGTAAFGERMRPVYGLFLFGGAAAFGAAEFLQQALGVPGLLLVAVFAVSFSRFLLASKPSVLRYAELIVLAALIFWPGFTPAFMQLFKSGADIPGSVANQKKNDPESEVVYSGWGKYSYVEIMKIPPLPGTPDKKKGDPGYIPPGVPGYSGFYNDFGMWYIWPQQDVTPEMFKANPTGPRDLLPFLLLPTRTNDAGKQVPTGSIALIGSGGGREVMYARLAGAERILALELEPAVVEAAMGPLDEDFAKVYTTPPVEPFIGEARGYIETTEEKFDVILLMSVGGYPQMMLEPGNMIRTTSAFKAFVDGLKPGGSLAIAYDKALDTEGTLIRQYHHTLTKLGMDSYVFERVGQEDDFVLIAFRNDVSPEAAARRDAAVTKLASLGQVHQLSATDLEVENFQEITDNRPYLAGNMSEMIAEKDIIWMFWILTSIISVAGGIVCVMLWNPLKRQNAPVHPAALLLAGILVGANFMLLEHLCVIQLFQYTYQYYNALVISIVAFLTLTGLGSLLIGKRVLPIITVGTVVLMAVWIVMSGDLSITPKLALLIPSLLVTGTFFPLIFEQVPGGRLQLFSMDAVGAAFGAILAFFVPMLFGFEVFTTVAVIVFFVTCAVMLVLMRRFSQAEAPAEQPVETAAAEGA